MSITPEPPLKTCEGRLKHGSILNGNIGLRRVSSQWKSTAGISGSDVRDMMLEAVEKRFRATRAPHAIEHLSDNGSAYTARDTRLFAQALNLTPCFTPVASPQSNGMSEAFVKTLKRDYIRIAALPDAETALRLIDGWIEDYNEIHPHSALKMASPRQFIRAKSN